MPSGQVYWLFHSSTLRREEGQRHHHDVHPQLSSSSPITTTTTTTTKNSTTKTTPRRNTHVHVVQDEMNAIVRPPIGHGVLGLVVELDHPPLVKAGLGHVFRVGTHQEVHLFGGQRPWGRWGHARGDSGLERPYFCGAVGEGAGTRLRLLGLNRKATTGIKTVKRPRKQVD